MRVRTTTGIEVVPPRLDCSRIEAARSPGAAGAATENVKLFVWPGASDSDDTE